MLERGEVESDTLKGKLTKQELEGIQKRREALRERNLKIIKLFSKGGKFAGRRLDPKALFKGDELESVANQPGGVMEAMAMKSSLFTAVQYLAEKQRRGEQVNAELDYTKVEC